MEKNQTVKLPDIIQKPHYRQDSQTKQDSKIIPKLTKDINVELTFKDMDSDISSSTTEPKEPVITEEVLRRQSLVRGGSFRRKSQVSTDSAGNDTANEGRRASMIKTPSFKRDSGGNDPGNEGRRASMIKTSSFKRNNEPNEIKSPVSPKSQEYHLTPSAPVNEPNQMPNKRMSFKNAGKSSSFKNSPDAGGPMGVTYERKVSMQSISRLSIRESHIAQSIKDGNEGGELDRPVLNLYPRKSIVNPSSEQVGVAIMISKDGKPDEISRYASITSFKRGSMMSVRRGDSVIKPPIVSRQGSVIVNQADYNEYLMLQQRHSSSNFIQQMDSADLVYQQKPLSIKMLGPYLVGGRIGKGAFGKVKEAVCLDSLQRIAIKIVAKKRVKKMVDTVIREIKLLRRLKHENIVTLVDVFAKVEDSEGKVGIFPWFLTIEEEPIVWIFEDGSEEERSVRILKWYIVLEFCACSLQNILDHAPDHKIPIYDAHSYFVQLIKGIDYLHSQKVIHRDIKPGNMLVTTDGVIKIADFGIAEQYDFYDNQNMTSHTFAGTHQFMPPEVLNDDNEQEGFDGTKVDIWACGITLYYMISGTLPFDFVEEGNIIQLHDSIIKCEYSIPPEASDKCRDLILRILEKNPDNRLRIDQILSHPWSLSHFIRKTSQNIVSYHHSKEQITGQGEQVQADDLIPCETTMLPYMLQLYQAELEEDLHQSGVISLWGSEDDESHGKTKLSGWIKNAMKIK
ncbi:kinase-like domain-containing protein [Globomyces pollinis-pini]|nr:kinase-like domain-containing protein [Globomyces pollinis-pini]